MKPNCSNLAGAEARQAPVLRRLGPAPYTFWKLHGGKFPFVYARKEIVMARHHRNLDDWEAEHGITVGHTHPLVRHNTPEAGSFTIGKTVIAKAARRSARLGHRSRRSLAARVDPEDRVTRRSRQERALSKPEAG
jgi:hypothetical protein